MDNYSLSDLRAVTDADNFGGGSGFMLVLLFLIIFGGGAGGFGWGNNSGYGQYATAASQQEILFGQQFQNLDNKMDRLANGICDSTYALNNAIMTSAGNTTNAVVAEGRATQQALCDVKAAVHAEGEATRAMIQQNKIESLQAEVNELKTQNMFCGIPRINPYGYGVYAYNGCGCNNI